MEQQEHYHLRMSKELHDRLVAEAREADRSLHKEILHRLRRSLEAAARPAEASANT